MEGDSMIVSARHVICLLGRWQNFSEIEALVRRDAVGFTFGHEYSQLAHDSRMPRAFAASADRPWPTLTQDDGKAIDEHTAVAYVLSPPLNQDTAQYISGHALALIASLFDVGCTAAKSESAGLAHGKARWLALARDHQKAVADGDEFSAGAALYKAWVQRGLTDESGTIGYSLGLHLLGHRDTEYPGSADALEAIRWIDLMGYYLVADKPKRPVLSGDGFRLAADGPRRVIEQHPCRRYKDDSYFFNPYGYNRLLPDGPKRG
jgi:hypothetical protein